jgi:hypothetical protein
MDSCVRQTSTYVRSLPNICCLHNSSVLPAHTCASASKSNQPRYRQRGEAELWEVRKQVTFAPFAEDEDIQKVTSTVESLFTLLQESFRP